MKKSIALAAAAAALLVAGGAQAQARTATSPLYGEVGYTFTRVKADDGPSFNPGMLRGIIGYDFHPNFAVEGMAAVGTQKDTSDFMGVPVTVDPRTALGVYLKPKANLGGVEVFGRLGYTSVRAKVSAAGFSDSGTNSGFSYGIGANVNISPRMYVGADWMRYNKDDGVTTEGATISVGFRF